MKARIRFLAIASLLLVATSCATFDTADDGTPGGNTEDLAALDKTPSNDPALEADLKDSSVKTDASAAKTETQPADDFAQFDENKTEAPPQQAAAETPPPEVAPTPPAEPPPVAPPPTETPPPAVQAETPPPADPVPQPPVEATPIPEPPAEAQPTPVAATSSVVNIKSLQFKGNDTGGTVIVDADGPLTYTSKMNAGGGTYTIEIPNSKLSRRLSKSLITRDFQGSISSVEASQAPGANVSRLLVHLREGATEPVVQVEGTSLLIVSNEMAKDRQKPETSKILNSTTLEEFISGNMVFSGRKISIETDEIELRDLFKLISEEGGVNLVISDDVKGKMSVKLRQVPWDQALVMIMKAKYLSYTRSGNVLRISSVTNIQKEEEGALKMAIDRQQIAPLVVKLIPLNYAKTEEIEKQIKPFLTKRGSVVGDVRTSSVVVSDIEETIERVAKLVASIDVPPQQVLIEGKIVEASDSFQRQIGINWGAPGQPVNLGASSTGSIFGTLGVAIQPGGGVSPPFGQLNFNVGVLDVLGQLSATLQLQEQEGNVKILSSPRVVAMHNEPAVISQNNKFPVITTTVSNGTVSSSASFQDVKLELKVTPSVTFDGGVIMKVDVLREIAGEIAVQATQARPINSRSANTKVMVRNGQTAVIGGIYQNDTTETEYRVPWLGSIPVLGWLFKSTSRNNNRNELLVFITPRILGQLDSQTIGKPAEGGAL